MIGTGIDLVHVPGFAEQWRTPGTRFERAFTPGELRDCQGGRDDRSVASLAARWAAKEALIKAWSASLWGQPPVADEQIHPFIEVVRDAWDRPRLRLHGVVAEHLAGVTGHVSLSHDGDAAIAMVTLTRP